MRHDEQRRRADVTRAELRDLLLEVVTACEDWEPHAGWLAWVAQERARQGLGAVPRLDDVCHELARLVSSGALSREATETGAGRRRGYVYSIAQTEV